MTQGIVTLEGCCRQTVSTRRTRRLGRPVFEAVQMMELPVAPHCCRLRSRWSQVWPRGSYTIFSVACGSFFPSDRYVRLADSLFVCWRGPPFSSWASSWGRGSCASHGAVVFRGRRGLILCVQRCYPAAFCRLVALCRRSCQVFAPKRENFLGKRKKAFKKRNYGILLSIIRSNPGPEKPYRTGSAGGDGTMRFSGQVSLRSW